MTPTSNFSHRGWTFSSVHKPISDARDIDNDLAWLQTHAHAGANTNGPNATGVADTDTATPAPGLHALPEMYFGNNSLEIRHPASGLALRFDPRQALACVEVGASGKRWQKIKVKAAETWQRRMEAQRAQRSASRTSSNVTPPPTSDKSPHRADGPHDVNPFDIRPEDIQVTPKPYDWTFSTDYVGTVTGATPEPTDEELPLHKLRVQEPILFYDENILYEDELGDNGVSKYSIKIRVMPSCFFILARLFLRVDNVMFALHDTRIYHAFGSDCLLREYSTRNVDYMSVKDRALRECGSSASPGFGSPGLSRAPVLGARPPAGLRGVGGLVGGGGAGAIQGGSATNLADPDHPMVPTLLTNEGWVGQVVAELSEPNEVKKEKIVLGTVVAEAIPH
ncbi:TIP41-like family-domain-containing protein [Catenaria anguillulae PL171]|uniref:TIP41-like family-domain-containing protein n=1 Tax=Catenaria anguillulae PL171 TaxID=765915 RepID=A0A1Y2HQS5_9FUNG|nr:TIP41-like family-domain-containing protein [Catenaria anguillulae PL171]